MFNHFEVTFSDAKDRTGSYCIGEPEVIQCQHTRPPHHLPHPFPHLICCSFSLRAVPGISRLKLLTSLFSLNLLIPRKSLEMHEPYIRHAIDAQSFLRASFVTEALVQSE